MSQALKTYSKGAPFYNVWVSVPKLTVTRLTMHWEASPLIKSLPISAYTSSHVSIVYARSDRRLFSQPADRRKYSISATKLLRLFAATLVGLSFVILHVIKIPEVGSFAHVSDGKQLYRRARTQQSSCGMPSQLCFLSL
jgi:hypothetical protein